MEGMAAPGSYGGIYIINHERTPGSAQSQSTDDHTAQPQHSDCGGPESPGRRTVNRGGGWLGNMRGHQHGIHKPPEQRHGSQGGENKREGSFHQIFAHYPTRNEFPYWKKLTYLTIGAFVKRPSLR